MPLKLDVEEALAFLFTALDACGIKLDYRLVGDAVGLNPAAARMRFTRLKRAVENGDFKHATLVRSNAKDSLREHRMSPAIQDMIRNAPRRTAPRTPSKLVTNAESDEDEDCLSARSCDASVSRIRKRRATSGDKEKTSDTDDQTPTPEKRQFTCKKSKLYQIFSDVIGDEDTEREQTNVSQNRDSPNHTRVATTPDLYPSNAPQSTSDIISPFKTEARAELTNLSASSNTQSNPNTPMFLNDIDSDTDADQDTDADAAPLSLSPTTHIPQHPRPVLLDDDDLASILAGFDPSKNRNRNRSINMNADRNRKMASPILSPATRRNKKTSSRKTTHAVLRAIS